jgi:ketosteroid isomerase-like protein
MKHLILRGVSFGLVTTLMVACNEKNDGQGTTGVDKEQIKQEIQAKEDAFAQVYNSGTLKNIGYYADDATSYFQNTAPLVGKPAIIEFLLSDVGSNSDKISFKTTEIFPSSDGNMVVEIGSFKVVDSASNPVNSGNYMTMFQKRDGKYVAVRDMSTSDGVRINQ